MSKPIIYTTPFANFASAYGIAKIRLQIPISVYFYDIMHDHCLIVKVIQIARSQIFLLIWLIHKDCSLFQTFTVYACSIRDLAFTLVYWFGAVRTDSNL